MEIDKIQLGQLSQSKGIEKSFEDLDVNNDGVINEEDKTLAAENQVLAAEITNLLNSVDEETELVDSADFDENEIPTANNTVAGQNTTSSSQATLALMQFEISKLNNNQEKIQDEIEEKEAEYKKKQKELEDKQEELEVLVKETQNDNSKAPQISDLQSEINILSSELSTLASAIEKLESDYSANSLTIDTLSMSLQVSENTSETTTTSLDTASETQEAEKAGYRNASEEALAAAYTGEEEPAMIDSAGNGPMVDNSEYAKKIRRSVKNLTHEPFKKLSEKKVDEYKNNASTIKNPDGTYTAKANLNGAACTTFDEEGNILYQTYVYGIAGYNLYTPGRGGSHYARTVTYDGSGRLLAKTLHDGSTITYEYNDDETYTKTVMKNNKTTTYKYKNDGELISKEEKDGVDEQKKKKAHAHTHSDGSYTIPGVVLTGIQRDASQTYDIGKMTLYDCSGKPILKTETGVSYTNWRGSGNRKGEALKYDKFDDEGRPLRSTSASGTTYEYEYHEDGKMTTTTTSKNGRVTQKTSQAKYFLQSHGT